MSESPRELMQSVFGAAIDDVPGDPPPLPEGGTEAAAPSPRSAMQDLLGGGTDQAQVAPPSPSITDTFIGAGKAALSGLDVGFYDLAANTAKAGALLGPDATKSQLLDAETLFRRYSDDLRMSPKDLQDAFGLETDPQTGEISGPLASRVSYKIYNSLGGMALTAAVGAGSIGTGFIIEGAANGIRDADTSKEALLGAGRGAAHGFFLDRAFKLVHAAGLNPLLSTLSSSGILFTDAIGQGASVEDAATDALALGIIGLGLDGRAYQPREFKTIGEKTAKILEKATQGIERPLTESEGRDAVREGLKEEVTKVEFKPADGPQPLEPPKPVGVSPEAMDALARIVDATATEPTFRNVGIEQARQSGVSLETIPPAGDTALRTAALNTAATELSTSLLNNPVRANPLARRSRLFPDIDPTKVVVEADQASVFESAAMIGEPMIFFSERLDGFADGPMKRMFYDKHVDSMNRYFDLHTAHKDFITSRIEEMSGGQKGWEGTVVESEYNVAGLTLTGTERMAIIAMNRDPQARFKLLSDGFEKADGRRIATGLTEGQLQEIEDSATPQELAIMETGRQVFDDLYEPVAQAFARTTGQTLPKIQNYYPNESAVDVIDPTAGSAPSMVRQFGVADEKLARDVTPKSMTKTRQPGARQVLRADYMGTLLRHVDQASFYIARAEVLQDFRDLAGHPDVVRALQVSQGTGKRVLGTKLLDAQGFLNKWVEDVSRAGVGPTINASETALRWLRANSTAGLLAYRVGTMVKQTASAFTAMADHTRNFGGNVKAIPAGMQAVIRDPAKWVQWGEEKFPFIKNRQQEVFLEDLKALGAKGGGKKVKAFNKAQRAVLRAGMAGIQYLDKLTITGVAHGVYHGEILKGKTEAEAVRTTNEILTRTQPTAGQGDLAPLFRSGEGLRALSSFTQQINKNSNLDRETLIKIRRGDIKSSQVPGYILFRMVLPGLMILLADNAVRPSAVTDKDKLLAQGLTQITGGLPIAGPLLSSTIFSLSRGELDLESPRLAPFAGPARVLRGARNLDSTNPRRAMQDILSGGATIVGLPGDSGRIAIEGIEDIVNGTGGVTAPFFSRGARGAFEKKKRRQPVGGLRPVR